MLLGLDKKKKKATIHQSVHILALINKNIQPLISLLKELKHGQLSHMRKVQQKKRSKIISKKKQSALQKQSQPTSTTTSRQARKPTKETSSITYSYSCHSERREKFGILHGKKRKHSQYMICLPKITSQHYTQKQCCRICREMTPEYTYISRHM